MHPTIDYTKMQQNVIGITSKSDLKNDNPINGAKSTNCDFEENKQPLQSLSALFNDEKVRVAETTIKSSYTHSFDELMHKLHAHKQELDNQIGVLRQSQAALEESRTRYVELFEFAPVGYVSLNAEGMIVKINLNGANLLGVEGNNLISRCLAEFIADEYQDQWHQLCLQAKQTRRKQIYEMPIRQNDGTLFHAHFDCLYQEANNASSALHIIFTDITKRKKTEEELRIARVIQMSLLPQGQIAMPGVSVSALCVPAREVGGDYYDFFPLGDDRFGLLIADVSGKGTSAALYMAELKGLMLSLSQTGSDPMSVNLRNWRVAGK